MTMRLTAPTPEPQEEARRRRPVITGLLRDLARDECGQDLIEYALLAGFITLGVVLATTNLGNAVNGIYGTVGTQVAAIPAP